MGTLTEDNREIYAAQIAARDAQAEPEPLHEFAARIGVGPGEAVPVTRSAHGDFAQEPGSDRWVWVSWA